jgi:hypothetical protein
MKCKTTKILCYHCKKDITKKKIQSHLNSAYQENEKGDSLLCCVTDNFKNSKFILYFIVNLNTTLLELDYAIKQIWLLCCKNFHPSKFGEFKNIEKSFILSTTVSQYESKTISYLYDTKKSTELTVNFGKKIKTDNSLLKIKLVARNFAPEYICECGELATVFINDEMYCDDCKEEDEGEKAIANSPRMGICSYEGENFPVLIGKGKYKFVAENEKDQKKYLDELSKINFKRKKEDDEDDE